MAYSVYCHTNKINGKRYIGITKRQPEKRWANGYGYSNNRHFFAAIQKYGWDSFSHEVWFTDLSYEDACLAERELIAKYDSANQEKGYNVDLGGTGLGTASEEHKRAISEARKGKPHPHKGRPLTGDKSPTYGTHRSEYVKQKARETNSIPVLCVETGMLYESGIEAAKSVGISSTMVSYACKTGRPTKGFHFMKQPKEVSK